MGLLHKLGKMTVVALVALTLFGAGRALAAVRVVDQNDEEEGCVEGDFLYDNITDAVNSSNDNDTIEVCDGTYTEAFVIYQSDLTLESVNPLGATIQAPKHLTPGGAIIEVVYDDDLIGDEGAGVVIDGFRITGPSQAYRTCSLHAGVFIHEDAVATVSDNDIVSIRDNPLGQCQTGYGIRVGQFLDDDESDDPGTGVLTDNTISDYQKGGILVDGDGSSATITGNVVTGAGRTKIIAQNGIQISNTSLASTITDNTISNNSFNNAGRKCNQVGCYTATGVLEFNAGTKADKLQLLKHNHLSHNQASVIVSPNVSP